MAKGLVPSRISPPATLLSTVCTASVTARPSTLSSATSDVMGTPNWSATTSTVTTSISVFTPLRRKEPMRLSSLPRASTLPITASTIFVTPRHTASVARVVSALSSVMLVTTSFTVSVTTVVSVILRPPCSVCYFIIIMSAPFDKPIQSCPFSPSSIDIMAKNGKTADKPWQYYEKRQKYQKIVKLLLHFEKSCVIMPVEISRFTEVAAKKREASMFQIGELVVYGGEGVCRVESIGVPAIAGMDKQRQYYTLQPLYRSGQVLTPVDTKVLMRPIMTAEAARAFIAALPDLPPQAPPEGGMRVAREHYHAVCATYDCAAMAAMVKHTARRRQWALRHGKKVSQLDERFTRRAEDQLYGELAAALSLARDDMETYIRQSYPAWPTE